MFCAGGFKPQGWESFDMDVDILKPLPFPNECASHIHQEHGLEHIPHAQAWNFLKECHRVLAKGGRIRIAIPDIEKMWITMDMGRGEAYKKAASKEGTAAGAIRAAVFNHGHKAAWTGFMLYVFLHAVGFTKVEFFGVGESNDPSLENLEQHGKIVGEEINETETSVLEAVKP